MCHVLVIEDEPMIAEYVGNLALDAGATSFDVAATQNEAVACAMAHVPAVILSDVRLAEGTGPMAVVEIREQLGALPVIFITGSPDECQPCDDAAAILGKPIIAHEVMGAFRQVAPV